MFKLFVDDLVWNFVNNTLFMVITIALLITFGFQVNEVQIDIQNQTLLIEKIQNNQQKARDELNKVRSMQSVYFLQLSYTLNDMDNQVYQVQRTITDIQAENYKEKKTLKHIQKQLNTLIADYGKN